jgi:hypothetical protein
MATEDPNNPDTWFPKDGELGYTQDTQEGSAEKRKRQSRQDGILKGLFSALWRRNKNVYDAQNEFNDAIDKASDTFKSVGDD